LLLHNQSSLLRLLLLFNLLLVGIIHLMVRRRQIIDLDIIRFLEGVLRNDAIIGMNVVFKHLWVDIASLLLLLNLTLSRVF
jgi:hypothetical protein